MQRKIIHIDMDCFYAAIEERNNPKLRDKPLAVGGSPERRGVICTCNYIARKYGIHSAMATSKALKTCPDLTLIEPNMPLYAKISKAIHNIFYEYTDMVEPLSLDEAFLDITGLTIKNGSATLIAREIRQKIFAAQKLTASAGVAPNKFLAKIASDWRKPNGIFVITPGQVENFVLTLPVTKIFGVVKVTAEKLFNLGIKTCSDLQQMPMITLVKEFGSFGTKLYKLARGIDERPVEPNRVRKSLSVEHTFAADLFTLNECLRKIPDLHRELKNRLQAAKNKPIIKQFIKIKFNDFSLATKETLSATIALSNYTELFAQCYKQHNKPVRLIGLGVRFKLKSSQPTESLNLF